MIKSNNNIHEKIPHGILQEIIDLDYEFILNTIKRRQIENSNLENENYRIADKYISEGLNDKALQITNSDVIGYFDTFSLAQSEEGKNHLIRAAEIYWFNIFHNATIATANNDRLLIILRKLANPEMELKVLELYQLYCNPKKCDTIKNGFHLSRIELKENNGSIPCKVV